MDSKDFKKLLNKNKYQLFLFSCPASFPAQMGLHYWFVTNKKGKMSRWEVLYRKKISKKSWGISLFKFSSPHKRTKGFHIF